MGIARVQNLCLWPLSRGCVERHSRLLALIFYPLTATESRLRETQIVTYYTGYTPPHQHGVGPPSAALIVRASELQKRSLPVSRAAPLGASRQAARSKGPPLPITDVCPRKIPTKCLIGVRPMTMETRCCKVFFTNYSKKKPAEDTLVPPLWGKRGEVFFLRIICSRCCTQRNVRFHVENCQHADQKQLTRL